MGWFDSFTRSVYDTVSTVGDVATATFRGTVRAASDIVKDGKPTLENVSGLITKPLCEAADTVQHNVKIIGDIVKMVDPVPNRSEWMRDAYSSLAKKKVWEISMPGTHDAATSDLMLRWGPDTDDKLKTLVEIPVVNSRVRDWARAQDLSLIGQLNAGVRYFDLRIAVSPHDQSLRTTHSLESESTLNELLKPVGEWIEHHEKELIILDAQKLYNFQTAGKWWELINLFKQVFGDRMIRKCDSDKTFETLVQMKRRVLVLWDNNDGWKSIQDSAIADPNLRWIFERGPMLESYGIDSINHDDRNSPVTLIGNNSKRPRDRQPGDQKFNLLWFTLTPPETNMDTYDYVQFGTGSLKTFGPKRVNSRIPGTVSSLGLRKDLGWIVIADFIEYPNEGAVDTAINLNK